MKTPSAWLKAHELHTITFSTLLKKARRTRKEPIKLPDLLSSGYLPEDRGSGARARSYVYKSPGGNLFSSLLVKGGFTEMPPPSYEIHTYDTVTYLSALDFSSHLPSRFRLHARVLWKGMFDNSQVAPADSQRQQMSRRVRIVKGPPMDRARY